jgi:plastocyanin
MKAARAIGVFGLAALLLAVTAGAAETKLAGTVGPGFTIQLRDAQGQPVTRLDAGEFEIQVNDLSAEHNFHLSGPGVDVATTVEEVGERTFRVRLVDGRYTFVCDPHAPRMRGLFDVGASSSPAPPSPSPPSPPAPPPTQTPSAKVGARLALTVGPAATISLKTTTGRNVTLLRPGAYTVVVRDRSKAHNAHLIGAGAAKATGVGFVGTRTWRVVLRKGTLVVRCDPHRATMRATVRVA